MENKSFGSASGSRVPCHARSIGKKIAKLVILIVIVCNTICHNILLPLHCFHRNVVVHRYQIPHRCHCFILHIFRCRRFNCIFCLFRDSFKHVFFIFLGSFIFVPSSITSFEFSQYVALALLIRMNRSVNRTQTTNLKVAKMTPKPATNERRKK